MRWLVAIASLFVLACGGPERPAQSPLASAARAVIVGARARGEPAVASERESAKAPLDTPDAPGPRDTPGASPQGAPEAAVERGAVVLASSLTVRRGRVPTVVLPRAEDTRALHDMIADFAGGRACEVTLALPTLVCVRCSAVGARSFHPQSAIFAIDAHGPHPIALLDLFRAGTDEDELGAPAERVEGEDATWHVTDLALVPEGIESAVLTRDDYFGRTSRRDVLFRTIGHGELASRTRGDRPLGALLADRGLAVSPGDGTALASEREVPLRSTLAVRPGRVPTVVLADRAHTAALHALMSRYARGRRDCRVTLAVPTLVAMRCFVSLAGREGVRSLEPETTYFELDESGAARHVALAQLLQPGRWPSGELGRWGLLPWPVTTYRALAPTVRAGGALGRTLTALGLAVDERPHEVAIVQQGSLAALASRAANAGQIPIELITASADQAWQVASPRAGEVGAVSIDTLPSTTVLVDPACASRAVSLRATQDPLSAVLIEIPAGTDVLAARGSIGPQPSELGPGRLVYLVHGGRHGWAMGDHVLASSCLALEE